MSKTDAPLKRRESTEKAPSKKSSAPSSPAKKDYLKPMPCKDPKGRGQKSGKTVGRM